MDDNNNEIKEMDCLERAADFIRYLQQSVQELENEIRNLEEGTSSAGSEQAAPQGVEGVDEEEEGELALHESLLSLEVSRRVGENHVRFHILCQTDYLDKVARAMESMSIVEIQNASFKNRDGIMDCFYLVTLLQGSELSAAEIKQRFNNLLASQTMM